VIAGVADTHAALWYLLKNPRLSGAARDFMDNAANAGNEIVLSPISLAEIVYLVEKDRLPASAYDDLTNALWRPSHQPRRPRSSLQRANCLVKCIVVDTLYPRASS
jgi:PIN domain nuclease of toxin-antitoxin system